MYLWCHIWRVFLRSNNFFSSRIITGLSNYSRPYPWSSICFILKWQKRTTLLNSTHIISRKENTLVNLNGTFLTFNRSSCSAFLRLLLSSVWVTVYKFKEKSVYWTFEWLKQYFGSKWEDVGLVWACSNWCNMHCCGGPAKINFCLIQYKNPTHTKLKVNAVLLVCPFFQPENNPTK